MSRQKRLLVWQVNGKLDIDHPVQDDLVWASDRIDELEKKIDLLTEIDAKGTAFGLQIFDVFLENERLRRKAAKFIDGEGS